VAVGFAQWLHQDLHVNKFMKFMLDMLRKIC